MGGSGGGGGGFLPRNPRAAEVSSLVKKAQEQAATDKREAQANELLLNLLARFNARDVEGTRERLEAVQEALGSNVDVETVLLGGSVAKHTYVDGLSDVDALVVLEQGQGFETPDALKQAFRDLLQKRLPMGQVDSVREGDLAVTVTYKDGLELQLLPATRAGDRVSISDSTGKGWSAINPTAFQKSLTQVNQSQSGAVVPAVKLAKSLVSNLPRSQRLTGYHIEALAVEAFRGYDGRKTPVAMLRHFFTEAAQRVRTPIGDVTGQSPTVDGYLGGTRSAEREAVSAALGRVARSLGAAASPERWKKLVAGE